MSFRFNISIDDVSPHPASSTKVLKRCYRLMEIFPNIKFTLFIPAAYWRTRKIGTTTPNPLFLNNFPDFCQEIKSLPKENFEIGYHGYHHGIPGKSDNDEFWHLSYEQALDLFEKIFTVVKEAELEDVFSPIFRPPAWRMSPDAIRAAREVGIDILALSPKQYAKDIYSGEDEKFKKVVYYNSNPPFDKLELFNKTEVVYHACEWDRNYLGDELTAELIRLIDSNINDIEFCFMEGLI